MTKEELEIIVQQITATLKDYGNEVVAIEKRYKDLVVRVERIESLKKDIVKPLGHIELNRATKPLGQLSVGRIRDLEDRYRTPNWWNHYE